MFCSGSSLPACPCGLRSQEHLNGCLFCVNILMSFPVLFNLLGLHWNWLFRPRFIRYAMSGVSEEKHLHANCYCDNAFHSCHWARKKQQLMCIISRSQLSRNPRCFGQLGTHQRRCASCHLSKWILLFFSFFKMTGLPQAANFHTPGEEKVCVAFRCLPIRARRHLPPFFGNTPPTTTKRN